MDASVPKKHLLIDGYNIIHAWPELKKHLTKGCIYEMLLQAVRVIHDSDGYRLTCVFDGKGKAIQMEAPEPGHWIAFVFSPAFCSADAVIEQMVEKSKQPQDLYVATRDYALLRIITQLGAFAVTPEALKKWVECSSGHQNKVLNQFKKNQMLLL